MEEDKDADPGFCAQFAGKRVPWRKDKPVFVVHEHHASRLHWDLRLEKDGVLKSWAVPKEPSADPKTRRLAVQVDDHALGYATFEGTIPEGSYGAGTVKIWDRGEITESEWAAKKISLRLNGKKLKGKFVLLSFPKAGKNNWLFFKAKND